MNKHLAFFGDKCIARSFAVAIESDGDILSNIGGQEQLATNDRVFAQGVASYTQLGTIAGVRSTATHGDAELMDLARFNQFESSLPSPLMADSLSEKSHEVNEIKGTKRALTTYMADENGNSSKRLRIKGITSAVLSILKSKRSVSPKIEVAALLTAVSTEMSLDGP